MFPAVPMLGSRVSLLSMNHDPLGSIAAMSRMYKGIPTYSLEDISHQERVDYFKDAQATHLKAPLEAVVMHFFLEGVDRSMTHQMVRQRTAVFAQESLRFAVKENLAEESIKPPTLVTAEMDVQRIWHETLEQIEWAYKLLLSKGVPAEDARGLLPHCVATRLNYVTNLRALSEHAGNRLCTQAQFHWRFAFAQIVKAIRTYKPLEMTKGAREVMLGMGWQDPTWQFEMIADSKLFRPVCYQLGKCPFQASFDRKCVIRDRVELLGHRGVPSENWHESEPVINPAEWLLNVDAAR